MDITLIGGIILLGLLIIMVEIFFLPGTTLFGVVGGIILVGSIYLAFSEHGAKTGSIILGITTVACCILLYAGFKTYSSGKMALKDVMGKTEPDSLLVNVGDEGFTTSYLRPNGKASIKDNKVEVYSLGEYIESNKAIIVVKIAENKIFVKTKNENLWDQHLLSSYR
ncbi:MAG: hypothetical protein SH857_11420 [Chitinophagales bacterium]|nr:hypothetical protein [Chitinophagales bacterium]